jgi:D-alanine-D-alanine ligase-like ATP-grasp enzyme
MILSRVRNAALRRARLARAYVRIAATLGIRHAFRRWRNDHAYIRQRPERLAQLTRAIWIEAAEAVGARVDEITPGNFEFRLDGVVAQVRGQRTPLSTPDSIEQTSEKARAQRRLREAGLPTPDHVIVDPSDTSKAEGFLALAGSCIAKPTRGGGGQGVVGAICTDSQLRRAIARISRENESNILLEQEIPGEHYRLLVLDGELLDVVRRSKPQVVGDGHATVEELILREYERRLASANPGALKPFVVDLDCLFTLELQGLDLRSVLPAGAVATVMTASNFGGPSDSETYRGSISPTLADEARRACQVLGVRLGGIDIIATRTDVSLAESGGAILEVNPIPALHHHYAVANPASATRVAIPILRCLLADAAAHPDAAATSAE